MRRHLLVGAGSIALMGSWAAPALAQDTAAPAASETPQSVAPEAEDQGQDIVVTGIRASLQSAQSRKRNAASIIDSIVADDIGKLPDANTTEALQRISGIQVSRDRGEGGSVAIRGLSQVLATLNGREIFTAGGGRSFNLQDFPAELLAGIDVYKTPTADLVEGGIGGIIDLRTRMPLDFDKLTVSGSARVRYNDLAKKANPLGSLLIADKWQVGDGEMGILLDGSYQKRDFRADIDSVGTPIARTDLIPGRTINMPNGDYEPLVDGERTRIGLDGTFQWRINPSLEFYVQADYQKFEATQQQRGLNNPLNNKAGGAFVSTAVPGTIKTFEGTDDFQSGQFNNLPFSTFGVTRDTLDENQQYSIGGKWTQDNATLTADFSYQKSKSDLYYNELDLTATAPRATFDVTGNTNGGVASMLFDGIDLTNINSYKVGALTQSINHYSGDSYAGRIDGDFKVDSDFISGFKVGMRYATRSMEFEPIRFFQTPAAGVTAGSVANLFEKMPFTDFYQNAAGLEHDYLTAVTGNLRDNFDQIRKTLGIGVAPAVDPKTVFGINEKVGGGYALMEFATHGRFQIDGSVGVRVVNTNLSVTGFQVTTAGGTVVSEPIDVHNNYISVLPSGNVRLHLTDKLQLRLSASQTLTRPDFGQLSPSLTLVPASQTASSGNPNLQPLRSDQADASLEYYFSKTGSLYAAGFYRKVKGFIFTTVTQGVDIDGISYNLSQPTNGADGTIKGIEVGGQTFFDFLPGALSGFGVQANYTYVDSETPSAVKGFITPLPNLSKHSFNISGLYEKNGLSVRVAYNYRSKFYQGLYTGNGAVALVYRKGYGWLDASINYDITKNFTLTLEGANLLRTREATYNGVETEPGQVSIDDRQFLAGVRFKF